MSTLHGARDEYLDHPGTRGAQSSAELLLAVDHHYYPLGLQVVLAADGAAGAVVLFAVGNAVAFALEALVAGVQALRLEFYELFSRVFIGEGRPFRPWTVPVVEMEAAAC